MDYGEIANKLLDYDYYEKSTVIITGLDIYKFLQKSYKKNEKNKNNFFPKNHKKNEKIKNEIFSKISQNEFFFEN